jgi:LPS sulfotransferase NodH
MPADGGLTRFVILAVPRAGTNMLCTLLGSHPRVLCHHELFNDTGIRYALELRDSAFDLGTMEERERDPRGFLERAWAADLGHSHVGFKMTHRQGSAAEVFAAVMHDRGVRKIVLRRENRVRTFVSRLIAERTGQWEVYRGQPRVRERPSVIVDVGALEESIATDDAYYAELEAALAASGQPFLRVAYERLEARAEQARMLEFLGLPPARLEVTSLQQNPEDLRELVANFDELEARLGSTELVGDLGGRT